MRNNNLFSLFRSPLFSLNLFGLVWCGIGEENDGLVEVEVVVATAGLGIIFVGMVIVGVLDMVRWLGVVPERW